MSSPMQVMFSQGMMMSSPAEKMLKNLEFPGTIMDVIVPVFKSAVTSCTCPRRFAFLMLMTSLCLKSRPLSFSMFIFLSFCFLIFLRGRFFCFLRLFLVFLFLGTGTLLNFVFLVFSSIFFCLLYD